MNVIGIISEYNPFHMGHLYHIQKTKKIVGEDSLVVSVMSGNYTQRGDFAVFNKWARAEAAVRTGGGIDLVLELQAPFSSATAERFALAGVRMLDACGAVTHLSFGSEAGSIAPLDKAARYLESEQFNGKISEAMKDGSTYAAARQRIATGDLGRAADVLKTPNNTLGIEYLRALVREKSEITPITIAREGAEHDSSFFIGDIASASHIRRMIFGGQAYSAMRFLPEQSIEIAIREISRGTGPVSTLMNSAAMLSYLRRLSPEDYTRTPDVSEGLHMRLYNAARESRTVTEIADLAKTKRYTHSRLRRIIVNTYLGITEELAVMRPQYLRVLAFNDRGRTLIREIKEKGRLPVITKPTEINSLDEAAQWLFRAEALATDLYTVSYPSPDLRAAGSDYRYSPKYLSPDSFR